MKYNDISAGLGIIQKCERYCGLGKTGISGDANKLEEFTEYANSVNTDIWHWIFTSQGVWEYDDSNNSGQPEDNITLVADTQVYSLPSTALTVRRVEVKNSAGLWEDLRQITEKEIPVAIPEYNKSSGQPYQYQLIGDEIRLFPAPDYSLADALRVYFDRTSSDFAVSDTTKTPGFASPYHKLLAVGMSIEWLKAKRPDSKTLQELKIDWFTGETKVIDFYSQRNKDNKTVIRTRRRIFK